jgi:hypothetical protein
MHMIHHSNKYIKKKRHTLLSWVRNVFFSAVTSSFNSVYFSVSVISKIYIKVTFAGRVNVEAVFWHTNVNIVDVRIGISFFFTYAMTDKHPDHFVQIVIDNSLELEDITVFTQMFLSFNITTERLDKNITENRHILIYLSFFFFIKTKCYLWSVACNRLLINF